MTEINAINLIRKQLISESTINALVSNRVYHGDLVDKIDPEYPCITFLYQGGDFEIKCVKEISDDNMTFQIWSDDSWEECYSVFGALRGILYSQKISDSNVRLLFRQVSKPVPLIDVSGDNKIYYLSIVYEFELIEI